MADSPPDPSNHLHATRFWPHSLADWASVGVFLLTLVMVAQGCFG